MENEPEYTYPWIQSPRDAFRVVYKDFDKLISEDDPRILRWYNFETGVGGGITLSEPLYEFDDYVPADITDHETMRLLGVE
jgi:hypothetical protein